jgi:hypothetical protein
MLIVIGLAAAVVTILVFNILINIVGHFMPIGSSGSNYADGYEDQVRSREALKREAEKHSTQNLTTGEFTQLISRKVFSDPELKAVLDKELDRTGSIKEYYMIPSIKAEIDRITERSHSGVFPLEYSFPVLFHGKNGKLLFAIFTTGDKTIHIMDGGKVASAPAEFHETMDPDAVPGMIIEAMRGNLRHSRMDRSKMHPRYRIES